jgi:CBS domain containing-hemolysin-like protein
VAVIDIALGLAAAVLLILANGVFVAAEFALVAVDRDRVERRADAGDRHARATLAALRRLSFHLSGAQLGITATSLVLGFIAEPAVARVLRPLLDALPVVDEDSSLGVAIVLALALATVAQMVVGELLPKGLAIARPLPVAFRLVGPMRAYNTVFGPLIAVCNAAAAWLCRRLGVEPQEELTAVRSLEELELLIHSSGREGTLDAESLVLLTRSIRFGQKTAADALVPRTSIVALEEERTVADLVHAALATGHSRFPVSRRDLDDLVGVAHVKDVFGVPAERRAATPVTAIMLAVQAVPESRDLESLLVDMRAGASPLVVVVDEYGGTAGIVTVEDVLEEIVGDIEDEYDQVADALTAPQRDGTWIVEGALHRDEVHDLAGLDIPAGDYDTLAGFLLHLLGRIPAAGDTAEHEGWRFGILEMDRHRIATVRLAAPEATGEAGGAGEGAQP